MTTLITTTTMLPVVEISALAMPRPAMSAMRPPGVRTSVSASIVSSRAAAPGSITARAP